jgi:predicted dehydrogenase
VEKDTAGVKFGIIGGGHRGVGTSRGDSFARALAVVGATVTAFYDIVEENAHRAAEAVPGARPFADWEAFLGSGIEAVVIASPVNCHAQQAVACLERGIHVLSEVTAASNLEDAHRLVEAAGPGACRQAGAAQYMLAENYRYLDEVELIKRLQEAGRFGEVYFAEGAYVHDCKALWRNPDGSLTWRGKGLLGVYCTHSLGPVLYLLEDRVASVSSLANPSELYDPDVHQPGNHVMLMRTEKGRTVLVRVDHLSSRPHDMTYYSLQGNRGAYRATRAESRQALVWLADEHEPSRVSGGCSWHPLWDYAGKYIPERLAVGPEARRGGHGTSEYWMLLDFLRSIREGTPPPIDVHVALDYTLPGILAAQSAAEGGATLPVPDSRDWAKG